jgi:GAF domain-containing protein
MGGELPIPRIAIGDSPDAKRAAFADFLAAAKAALGEDDDGGGDGGGGRGGGGHDAVAAMATLAFLLARLLPHATWSGFYRARRDGSLIVGPYVGTSMGCLRIPAGRGVCGAAAAGRRALVVPDVAAFPGHIACASSTRSELVVPVYEGGDAGDGRVVAVVDLDSDAPAAFDDADADGVAALCQWLGAAFFPPRGDEAAAGR